MLFHLTNDENEPGYWPPDPGNLPVEKPPEPPKDFASVNQPANKTTLPPPDPSDIPQPDFTPTVSTTPAVPNDNPDVRKQRAALADKVKGLASSEKDAEKAIEATYLQCIE